MRPYAWSQIEVTAGAPIALPEKVSVEIRTNGQGDTVFTARPIRSREILLQLPGVTRVWAVSRRSFGVEFDDGTTLELTKPKGCGCGGAR